MNYDTPQGLKITLDYLRTQSREHGIELNRLDRRHAELREEVARLRHYRNMVGVAALSLVIGSIVIVLNLL